MMIKTNARRGFTLVELSIVLVIIGLIIGAVLTGQQIIQNARVTKALNDIQSYEAQFQTYQQNFGALPGDDRQGDTRFSNPKVTGHGDGNGVIGDSVTDAFSINCEVANSSENCLVWADLRAAGLIKNQLPITGRPPNPFGGVYAFQNGAFTASSNANCSSPPTTTVLCLNNVPAAAAQSIDTQLDDGNACSGIIQATTGSSAYGAQATDYSSGGSYVVCVRL